LSEKQVLLCEMHIDKQRDFCYNKSEKQTLMPDTNSNKSSVPLATAPVMTAPQVRTSILRRMVWESLLVSAFSIALLTGLSFVVARSLITQRLFAQLSTMASTREDFIEESMQTNRIRTGLIASRVEVRRGLSGEPEQFDFLYESLRKEFKTMQGMRIFDTKNETVRQYGDASPISFVMPTATTLIASIDRKAGWQAVDVYSPVRGASGAIIGTLSMRFDIDAVLSSIFNDLSLGKTAEVTLGRAQGGEVFVIQHSNPDVALKTFSIGVITQEHVANAPVTHSVQNREDTSMGIDETGKQVMSSYRFIPSLNMGLVLKVQTVEAFAGVRRLGLSLAAMGIFLIALSGVFAFYFARHLTAPILRLAQTMKGLAPGNWNFQRSVYTGDEVEVLDHVVADLTSRLKTTYENLEGQVQERTAELRNQYAQDRAILDSIPYGVLSVDPKGRVTAANPAAGKLLGLNAMDLAGKECVALIPLINKDHKTQFEGEKHPLLQCLKDRTPFYSSSAMHLGILRKDETVLPTMLSVTPLVQGEELLGGIVVFMDMTEERQIDYMKSEFISLASHQLRTPLSSILWYLELFDSERVKVPPDQEGYIREIEKSARRMEKLLETLIRVARLDEGTIAVEKQELNIGTALRQIIEEMKSTAKETKIATAIHIPKHAIHVTTDPVLLGVVMQNLFTNAAKYSRPGSQIEIDLTEEKDHVIISVKDQGLGIPKKDQSRIFQKFFRAANVRTIQANGTGLGLYITKTVMDSIGGKIWFESEEKKGTTFFIQLQKKEKKA